MPDDPSLYGITKKRKLSGKEISSSSGLAFSSQLSSLIAANKRDGSSTKQPIASGRARPKKEDIFSVHNKGANKRALKDLQDDSPTFEQKHSTKSDAVDEATWHRSKRKMEEKARLYAAMKRGDVADADQRYGVDFDRKWADAHEQGVDLNEEEEEDDDEDSQPESEVEYVDELGRTRKGTRAQAARAEYAKMRGQRVAEEPEGARPTVPSNIIYGDTIQAAAFNPDEPIAQQMAELAAKRDREVTPPPDTHFDGKAEIRTKGTGFYHFSADKEERARQMEALEKERRETDRVRKEKEAKREERKKQVEERKRMINERRGKAKADRFLQSLSREIDGLRGGRDVPSRRAEGETTVEASTVEGGNDPHMSQAKTTHGVRVDSSDEDEDEIGPTPPA